MSVLTGRIFAGHLRSIIGSMTVEEIVSERQKLATEVLDGSKEEMAKIGLTVDSLQIQSIDDTGLGYIDAMAAPHNAAIQRQAKIAQAQANQAAAEAEQESQRKQAEFARQTAVVQAQYKAEVDKAQAEAAQAGPLAQAQAQREVIATRTELAQRAAELRQQQLVAEVVKPAEAEAERVRILALADAEKMKIQAEAAASHNRVALDRMLIDQLPEIVKEAARRSGRRQRHRAQRRRRPRRDRRRPGQPGPGDLRFSAWRTRSTPVRRWVRPDRTQRAAQRPAVITETASECISGDAGQGSRGPSGARWAAPPSRDRKHSPGRPRRAAGSQGVLARACLPGPSGAVLILRCSHIRNRFDRRSLRRRVPRSGGRLQEGIARTDGGASVAVYHRGRLVLDLWGEFAAGMGIPGHATRLPCAGAPPRASSPPAHMCSPTAGSSTTTNGSPTYWPEFAQNGKGDITVRQVFSHCAGLHRLGTIIDHGSKMLDWEQTSGVSRHWLTAWSATRPRATLARMSSAVAVQTKGLGSSLCAAR